MQIDLKVPGALTYDSVRALLASKDDRTHRQLRVTTNGIAFLSDDVETEIWRESYSGSRHGTLATDIAVIKRLQNDKWVRSVHEDLIENWPNQKSNFIDS